MIKKIVNYIKNDSLKIIYINNSVNIQNYNKIIEISDTFVRILYNNEIIVIKGNDLKLNKLLDNEILITGIINKIEL